MFCGYWHVDFVRLLCFSLMLAGVASESVRPPPTFEIIEKGNYLNFHASAPESESPHCWTYMFWYRKCNEETVTTTATKDSNWTAKVEYDAACKYHVQLQAKYDTTYCGDVELDSNISKPVYFGQDGDPDLPFKVSMIVIPVIACSCLSIAIVLFRRHKQKLFPKVPSPSHFFNDMFDRNKEMTKSLYVRELYVPDEEVVEEIQQVMNSNQ